jgi:hypothetical protein
MKLFEKCGRCQHWMKKYDCPREAKGQKPNCESFCCEKFELDSFYKKKLGGINNETL